MQALVKSIFLSLVLSVLWAGDVASKTVTSNGTCYYDPAAAAFLSCDPLGHAASMDLYSYCNGDPVNNFDPDGRFGVGASGDSDGGASVFNSSPYLTPQQQADADLDRDFLLSPLAFIPDVGEEILGAELLGGASEIEGAVEAGTEGGLVTEASLQADAGMVSTETSLPAQMGQGDISAGMITPSSPGSAMPMANTVSSASPTPVFDTLPTRMDLGTAQVEPAAEAVPGDMGLGYYGPGGAPLPENGIFSRVMPAKYAQAFASGQGTLAGSGEVFIGAGDDLAGIDTVAGAQQKLSLFNDAAGTVPNMAGNVKVTFQIQNYGAAGFRMPMQTVPARGYGFTPGGLTGGGAREWLIYNGTASDLGIYNIQLSPLH